MIRLLYKKKNAIIATVLFTIALVGTLWYKEAELLSSDKEQVIKLAIRRNSNLALSLENYTIRTIQNADMTIQLIQSELEKKQSVTSFNKLFFNSSVDNSMFDEVDIINNKGALVISSNESKPGSNVSFGENHFFIHHVSNNDSKLYISEPELSPTINKPVILVSKRFNLSDGSFGGVIVLQIAPVTFTAFYEKAVVNKLDIVSLISPNGITYARLTGTVPSSGENISKSPLFEHLQQKEVGWYFAADAIRAIPTYFSYRRLKNYPIIATVGTAERDVLTDFNQRKYRDLLITSFISILIITFNTFLCIEIIQRGKYTKLLRENEEKFRLVFEKNLDAIILTDENGLITACNPAAMQLFKLGSITDQKLNIHSLLEHTAKEKKQDAGLQENKQPLLNGEIRFIKSDGTVFTGETNSAVYISGDNSKVVQMVIRDITERNRLKEELMTEKSNRQQQVMKQVIRAQERERKLIGSELHDNVCQILTTAKIYLSLINKNKDKLDEYLPKSTEFIEMANNEIRNLSHTLSAPTLGSKSLIVSINNLLNEIRQHSNIQGHFDFDTAADEISMEEKLALFRIIQEQVNNIIKHAEAKDIFITLKVADEVKLLVKDNGKGFDINDNSEGIGLQNIEARVKAFSGSCTIYSAPGKGCSVEVILPLSQACDED